MNKLWGVQLIDNLVDILNANNPFLIIVGGLTVGLLHAFEPDHLSAVSSQLSNTKMNNSKKLNVKIFAVNSLLKGVLWGMGHTSSIILIGLLVAGLSLNIHNTFFVGAEFIVGLVLVILGIVTFMNKNILKQKHIHPHKHKDGTVHTHYHTHNANHKHGHKSYLIGCIQGLAGSGSLVVLMSSAINDFNTLIYFLILFGASSIIGMTLVSGVIGLPFILLPKTSLVRKYLRYGIAGITLVIGVSIMFTVMFSKELMVLN